MSDLPQGSIANPSRFVIERHLALALDRALVHALDQAQLLASGPVYLHSFEDRSFSRTNVIDLDRALTLARRLDHTLTFVRTYTLDFQRGSHQARDLAHALHHALERTHALGFDLDRIPTYELDLDYARTRARARILADHLDAMGQRAVEISEHLERLSAQASPAEPVVAEKKAVPISRSAEHMVSLMMKLLPAVRRDRYAEEFNAELYDLAELKSTRTVQVVYALRQFGRVWQLREALLRPDRPRFHRLRRIACWVLASDWLTWSLLGPPLAFGVINVHLSQGWGSALFTLPGVAGFYAGVEWLRKRWGIEVKRRDESAGEPPNDDLNKPRRP
ncbi:hypothetical protein ABZ470_20070 [Streptosporangium sp. NPDC020072]|uniref:hypothetical protein n=1 Tax=Streptosporangium sp. NPDC020072 TaxID=3154788 RepID=UPI003429913A